MFLLLVSSPMFGPTPLPLNRGISRPDVLPPGGGRAEVVSAVSAVALVIVADELLC